MLSSSKVFKSEDCIPTHLWAALLSDNVWYKNIYKQCLKRQCLITGIEDKQVICLNVWEKKRALELARGWRSTWKWLRWTLRAAAVDLLLQLKGQHETRQVLIPSTPKPSNTVCITKREGNHLLKLLLQKSTLTMQLKLAIDFPVEGLSHHLVNCHPLKWRFSQLKRFHPHCFI